jgi:hypothetical protein
MVFVCSRLSVYVEVQRLRLVLPTGANWVEILPFLHTMEGTDHNYERLNLKKNSWQSTLSKIIMFIIISIIINVAQKDIWSSCHVVSAGKFYPSLRIDQIARQWRNGTEILSSVNIFASIVKRTVMELQRKETEVKHCSRRLRQYKRTLHAGRKNVLLPRAVSFWISYAGQNGTDILAVYRKRNTAYFNLWPATVYPITWPCNMTRRVPCAVHHAGVSIFAHFFSLISILKQEINVWDHQLRVLLSVL